MSLAINPDRVTQVLLDDGWHLIAESSLSFDFYEFVQGDGSVVVRTSQTGFQFLDPVDGDIFTGPLTSIHAVRYAG